MTSAPAPSAARSRAGSLPARCAISSGASTTRPRVPKRPGGGALAARRSRARMSSDREREPCHRHDAADDHVEHVVIRRHDDGQRHRDRHQRTEDAHDGARVEARERQADEQIPAEVEARQGRVAIHQRRRLQRAVGVRIARHGVRQPEPGQARRSDRIGRKIDHADRARRRRSRCASGGRRRAGSGRARRR